MVLSSNCSSSIVHVSLIDCGIIRSIVKVDSNIAGMISNYHWPQSNLTDCYAGSNFSRTSLEEINNYDQSLFKYFLASMTILNVK